MKIKIEPYNPEWQFSFNDIREELLQQLDFLNPQIEHIGSTSVPGLSAKPIIDILIGIKNAEEIEACIAPLMKSGYIYFEKFNPIMPYRRFFVKLNQKPEEIDVPSVFKAGDEIPNELNPFKLAHIHVLQFNSHHWTRHIAFRDYLKENDTARKSYQSLKEELAEKEWKDGNEYNAAKNKFVQKAEEDALEWYYKK